jgi:hypothetical protein
VTEAATLADCAEPLRAPTCEDGDCDSLELSAVIDSANAEIDDTTVARSSGPIEEQMWLNYYVTQGELDGDVRLLNDAERGWSVEHGTELRPSEEPAVGYVWAVAHDNRGGADWARLRVCFE